MTSKGKGIKAEVSETKLVLEARSSLNKALSQASIAENERIQNALAAAEEEDEQMGEEEEEMEMEEGEGEVEALEETPKKKSIKTEQHHDEEDEEMAEDEEDEEFIPAVKQPKSSSKHQKPIQQASYIMKLFDRSVNLARFSEDSPLYTLCRAWMRNQPRAVAVRNEKTSDPVIQTAEDGDVVEMPKIRIRKTSRQLSTRNNVKINTKDLDKLIDSEVWTKEKLLEFHRTRWQDEKSKIIENSRIFEEKHFAANLELLESLLKESEE